MKTISSEDVKTPSGIVRTRKYELSVQNAAQPFPMTVTIDDNLRLARIEVPASTLTVVRNDLVERCRPSVDGPQPDRFRRHDSGERLHHRGHADQRLRVPGRLRLPAIVLVGGRGSVDRDSTIARIPIFTQLAGALAEQGYLVLRYDKRGVGQSGGRPETATQRDYADDVIAAVKWLEKRDDVNARSITVAGHSEGAAVAMLAAAREKKIDALVVIAASGTSGADLILEQQQRELDRLKLSDQERTDKIELQKKIQAAVVSGKGWESLPEDMRKQADTPWFRSLLLFDPAEVMPRIKQPLLIVQGDLDTQVPPHHAEKLAALARTRKKDAGGVEVVHLPGINHLLVPATTGEVGEYPMLEARTITPDVACDDRRVAQEVVVTPGKSTTL